jgi:hypothetical protein
LSLQQLTETENIMIKRFRAPFLLALMAVSFALLPAVADAQKPALVKNVDEPGRNPYQQGMLFNQSTQVCTNFVCTLWFNPVPAGYRLVVTHVSVRYRLADNSIEAYTTLGSDGNMASDIVLPAPSFIGNNYYVVSSPVTFYVESGSSPTLFLSGNRVDASGSYSAQASIVGYLVAIP